MTVNVRLNLHIYPSKKFIGTNTIREFLLIYILDWHTFEVLNKVSLDIP